MVNSMRKGLIYPVALALAALAPGLARADNIDTALNTRAPQIMKYLKSRGYKNVGVLRFRTQETTRRVNFGVGDINGNMATRLENVLIIHNDTDEKKAIGIIRDAGKTASSKVGSWYRSQANRKKLFDYSTYPLAWGKKKVKPDAFLTGVVKQTGNLAKTTVTIEVFTKAQPKLARVTEFTVNTDRTILRDMGKNFLLAKRSIRRRSSQQNDQAAVKDAQQRQQQNKGKKSKDDAGTQTLTPDNIFGLAFELKYDDETQQINTESSEWKVSTPAEGKTISMVLNYSGTDRGRLGVVLKVNGLSTWAQEKEDSLQCLKWLMDRGARYTFRGFTMDDKTELRFKVLSEEASATKAADFGANAGFITIDVFTQKTGQGDEKKISMRGLSARARKPSTLKALQKQLVASAGLKRKMVGKRAIIVADDTPVKPGDIKREAFPNAVLLGSVKIRYYEVRGGQSTQMEVTE
jgi:hypothetical protein